MTKMGMGKSFYTFCLCATLAIVVAPSGAQAQTKAIMEGVAASRYTIKVDTTNVRVLVSTTSYRGGLSGLGLFVSSNVVVSSDRSTDHVVIYATGSIVVNGVIVPSTTTGNYAQLSGSNTFTGYNVFAGTVVIHGSTSTEIASVTGYPYAWTTLSQCLPGSTMTYTSNGGRIAFDFVATAAHSAGSYYNWCLSALMDSNYLDGGSGVLGMNCGYMPYANTGLVAMHYVTHNTVPSGSHTFCLMWSSEGSASIPVTPYSAGYNFIRGAVWTARDAND